MVTNLARFRSDLAEHEGWKRTALFAAYYTYVGAWLTLTTRACPGTHVFERDWDLLVILDTCRVDALTAVADEYDFVETVDSVWSVGSRSDEWLSQTFDRAYGDTIAETAYVTANPYTHAVFHEEDYAPSGTQPPVSWPDWDVVDVDDFALLDEVWRDGTDEELGVCTPETMTDRAIRTGREQDPDRLVVHYMQPHRPYIADNVGGGGHGERTDERGGSDERTNGRGGSDSDGDAPDPDVNPFAALKAGTADREDIWERYLDNLRLALDSVERLLENVDADNVVITADHGEAFGKYGLYEHPPGCPAPWVRRVPWVETTATDTHSSIPSREEEVGPTDDEDTGDDATVDEEVTERLADLGYL